MRYNRLRMVQWLLLAAMMYVAAILLKDMPQVSTGLWKAGHITSGAYLGYWIDRHLYGRMLVVEGSSARLLSRAIVIAACVIGMAFGL